MKIFVTGGAGYIGSICVEHLLEHGHQIAVFDNLSEGHRNAIHPNAAFFQGDLGDPHTLSRAVGEFQPDAVMHFAANALVGESMENPSKYFINNVSCGIHLLDAMVTHKVPRLVFSSTCATFGQPEHVPIDESLPQAPINPYGESKLIFEKILRWYHEIHGITYVALRYFNAAGATEHYGEDHRIETHLIPLTLQVALGKREHISVFGTDYDTPDGTCIRDYIHILDLAQAHRLALDSPKSACYNLGTGGGTSVREIIDCCRKITGHAIPSQDLPRRPGDPARLIAASSLIQSELGWAPEYQNIETIIQSAWNWHQKHPNGYGD